MSSGFCSPGNELLQSVICRMRLHAASHSAMYSLYVKSEFYQKSWLHFLRFFALTFHNFRRRIRSMASVPENATGFSKSYQHFPQTFQHRFFLYVSMLLRKYTRKCQPRKRQFAPFRFPLCGFHNELLRTICRENCTMTQNRRELMLPPVSNSKWALV